MARFLSQTLTLPHPPSLLASRLLTLRRRSHRSDDPSPQFIEIDLDGEPDVPGIRRLEDAIHGIIVRISQPDWLPFLPGTSYWVPPRRRRALGLIELVGKLAQPMGEEEAMSLTTPRGWPSLDYFVEGALSRLNNVIRHPNAQLPDNVTAYDNAVSALGKICQFHRDAIDASQILAIHFPSLW